MLDIPDKTDFNCNNIYLLDERQCIGDSLNYINYNMASLSAGIAFLTQVGSVWNTVHTYFQSASTDWIIAMDNVDRYQERWSAAYTTVKNLSSNWNYELSFFYPRMVEMNTWLSYNNNNIDNIIIPWMQRNFPASNFINKQEASVYVHLYKDVEFSFNFYRSYYEECTPNGGGGIVECTGCGTPSQGCNWNGRCINAYSYCRVHRSTNSAPLACTGSGGRMLQIGVNRSATDRHIGQIVRQVLRVEAGAWSIIQYNDIG